MRKTVLAIGLLIFLAAGLPAAKAAERDGSIGFVAAVRGEVTAVAEGGDKRPLTLKDPVYRNDTLKTGRSGRIQVVFADRTTVSLGRSSEMKVTDYRWDPDKRSGAMKTRVSEGFFRVMGGAITRTNPESFSTETPAATIGIRGSMYAGRVTPRSLAVVFQGGTGITVANAFGRVEISRPGFGTRVEGPDRPPQAPSRFSPEDLSDLELELAALPSGGEEGDPSTDERTSQTSEGTATVGDTGPATADDGAEIAVEGDSTTADSDPTVDSVLTDLDTDSLRADTATPIVRTDSISPVDNILVDSNQDILTTTTTETATTSTTDPPPTGTADLSGRYLSTLSDSYLATGSTAVAWSGEAAATSVDGAVNGQATARDGTVIPLDFAIPAYDPDGVYAEPVLSSGLSRVVNLLGADRTFSTLDVVATNLGDFAIFHTVDSFTDGTTYDFQELGFIGVPSARIPSDGLSKYTGSLLGFSLPEATGGVALEPIRPSKFDMLVNWHSGKIFGLVYDESSTTTSGTAQVIETTLYPEPKTAVFFFGDLAGTSTGTLRVVGSDFDPMEYGSLGPRVIDGSGTFGQFYGSDAEGYGLTAGGNVYAVYDQSPVDAWEVIGGALREHQDISAPTGSSVWNGFVVGVAEDMDNPNAGRRLFLNDSPSSFSLTVDRDAGTLSGTVSVVDAYDPSNEMVGVEVGGSRGSAYLLDDVVIAMVGGGSIRNDSATGTLKDYGNFLVSAGGDPAGQFMDYATWGYWEAAYADPGTGRQYHAHVPGSLWLAGELTPASDIATLASSRFRGTYLGGAKGVRISPYDPDPSLSQQMSELTNGRTDLTVDFDPAATFPVSGTLSFDDGTLQVSSAANAISGSGFAATVQGATSSQVNGAFFGPAAASVGGDFDAQLSTGDRFLGIFGGNLQR
jgi:hypothetical protein